MKLSLTILVCLGTSVLVHRAEAQKTPVSQSVDLVLVKGDDLSKVPAPPSKLQLVQTNATVTPYRNIYQILKSNGIAPDSEAFSLVYQLNPKISDLNQVTPDMVLTVPTVQGDATLKKFLQQGDLTQLTVNPSLRQGLDQQIDTLSANSTNFKTIPDTDTQDQLQSLVKSYQLIEGSFKRRTGPPLQPQTLIQLNSEAEILNRLGQNLSSGSTQLSVDDRKQVQAIFKDVNSVMNLYGQTLADTVPKGESYYEVTVNLKGGDPNLLNTIRVYYTFNGLFRTLPATPPIVSFGFPQLGSGRSEKLLMKNYEVWAAKDGDPNHPYSPPYLLTIDEATSPSLTVELSINKGTNP
jgi:hypothetical protein